MSLAVLLVGLVSAEEAESNFGLPTALSETQFDSLQEHSPFTRILNFEERIHLTGIAVIDGEQVATVHDKKREKSFVISGKPNEDGWKMVQVDPNKDLEKVSATIAVYGGEQVTLQFDEKQLRPAQRSIPQIKASPGLENKPPPTQEERRKFGEWVRGRMSRMSDEQKKKVGQIMQEKMKANPNLTDRQKGSIFVQVLDYVESGK